MGGQFAYHQCNLDSWKQGEPWGQCSLEWVQTNNVISFFSTNGVHLQYKNQSIRVMARGKTIDVRVVDTCGDHDCNGCCSTNANASGSGYLVDMEWFTVLNNWPEIQDPSHTLYDLTDLCWQPSQSD